MIERMIFSGFGGQGVLTLGQMIAQCAMSQGLNVTWMPSYGAEMRGGTANCSVIISDAPIGSPVVGVGKLDFLFAMNDPSVEKFVPMLKKDGVLVLNSSIVTREVAREDITVLKVDATNIAIGMGNAKVANMVMLAGYLKMRDRFSLSDIESVLTQKFGAKNAKIIPMNIEAIKKGMDSLS